MQNLIDMDIPQSWQFVRSIKASVENALAHCPKELRYAAGMTASELVGNAIKYGESDPPPPHLTCSLNDGHLVIAVSNRVSSEGSVAEVQERINQARAGNGETLFLGRLQEILGGSSRKGQLGLYRICYEGSFELSCSYVDHVLTITAVRSLP